LAEAPHVERVDPRRLHDLRRRVLRAGRADAVVADARDDDDGAARHYAGLLEGEVVACASLYPSAPREGGAAPAWQLRFMATDESVRGLGYGAAVLAAAEADLVELGAREVWANGRDSALGFYRRLGWRVLEGSAHLSAETQLPHHVIVKDLG
jgi:GNAT superfamily N-acetyltransferase